MGLAPASLVLLLLALLLGAHALDANQVGNLRAGIDIRIPLDAFVCDPWLVYYKIAPTAYGRSLGVNYNNVQLLLTTPDNARTPVITFNLPQGEGVVSWRVNMPWNSQFYVAPHGAIEMGDVVQVKKGGGGEACLKPPTQTTRYEFATYNGPAFKSLTERNYAITTRFPNSRMTSPEAGLRTHIVPAGILVTPTQASTPTTTNKPKPTSTPSQPKPTSTTPPNTSKPQATSSQPQETPSSQSGSTTLTETITSAPTAPTSESSSTQASQSSANFVPDPSHSSAGSAGQEPGSDAQTQRSGKSYTAPIVASVVIGTLLIVLAVLCCFMIRRRRQRERDERLLQPYSNESMMTEATAGGSIAPIIYEPQARSAKGPPTRRYDFPDESDTVTPTSPTRTSEIPMDLERALAVVAAHVRSAEAVIADPSGSPPRYSRTFASAPFARAGPSTHPPKRGTESVTATSATDSSDWSR